MCALLESNQGPFVYQTNALPTELYDVSEVTEIRTRVLCLQNISSSHLNYNPIKRKESDLNRRIVRPLVFKTSAISHSAILPYIKHALKELNPRPLVLETTALPAELKAYVKQKIRTSFTWFGLNLFLFISFKTYLIPNHN